MVFYLIGPFMGYGTTKEPLLALGSLPSGPSTAAIFFLRSSKKSGRTTLVSRQGGATTA